MATVTKNRRKAITGALALAQQVTHFPASRLVLDYDAGADVLYISLRRPQKATHTVEVDDEGILLHYRNRTLVGVTVLEASSRQ
jgi:uncharacterized protein YuzE